VVLVPGVPALLPSYAGLSDPVAELRAACRAAVGWLEGPVAVVADAPGRRVADHLLAEAGLAGLEARPAPHLGQRGAREARGAASGLDRREARGADGVASYLVVANGSATRGEKAPGHLDERAFGFDAAVEAALRAPDAAALAAVDEGLAGELWVGHPAGLRALGELLAGAGPAVVDYADDPFGVRYWVMRWSCES
jgi:hypothetical protein